MEDHFQKVKKYLNQLDLVIVRENIEEGIYCN